MVYIYSKSDKENKHVSVLIADKDYKLYYIDAFESSELMGVRRAMSYVKHNISTKSSTIVFTDNLDVNSLKDDEYIKHLNLPFKTEESLRNKGLERVCYQRLQQGFRWDLFTNNNVR